MAVHAYKLYFNSAIVLVHADMHADAEATLSQAAFIINVAEFVFLHLPSQIRLFIQNHPPHMT